MTNQPTTPPPRPMYAVAPKSPALAAVLSALIPGLGQVVYGRIGAGVAFFSFLLLSLLLTVLIIGFLLLPVVWIWAMVDAYRGNQRWNLAHGIVS